jgi:hypothetical protein
MEPPKIEVLDFSKFHPMDHSPWTARCRSFYGGSIRHAYLWWYYIAVPAIARNTKCKVNWHQWGKVRYRDMAADEVLESCMHCYINKP